VAAAAPEAQRRRRERRERRLGTAWLGLDVRSSRRQRLPLLLLLLLPLLLDSSLSRMRLHLAHRVTPPGVRTAGHQQDEKRRRRPQERGASARRGGTCAGCSTCSSRYACNCNAQDGSRMNEGACPRQACAAYLKLSQPVLLLRRHLCLCLGLAAVWREPHRLRSLLATSLSAAAVRMLRRAEGFRLAPLSASACSRFSDHTPTAVPCAHACWDSRKDMASRF
jgi:hypothetical protein